MALAQERAIRMGIRRGLALFRAAISEEAVAEAMAGQLNAVERAFPWTRFMNVLHGPVEAGLVEAAMHAATEAAKVIPAHAIVKSPLASAGFSFTQTNARAQRWAEREAATLIIDVDAQTRQAIRQIIVRMFSDGVSPQEAAKMLKSMVGLNPRYALAVDNLRRSLTEQGRDLADVAQKVGDYAERLERSRATTIARTEAMSAQNAGQHILWQDAQNQGLLDADVQREWLVADDERLCPICEPVPGYGPVGLNESFRLGDGSTILNPPAHPNCRCAMRLVFD